MKKIKIALSLTCFLLSFILLFSACTDDIPANNFQEGMQPMEFSSEFLSSLMDKTGIKTIPLLYDQMDSTVEGEESDFRKFMTALQTSDITISHWRSSLPTTSTNALSGIKVTDDILYCQYEVFFDVDEKDSEIIGFYVLSPYYKSGYHRNPYIILTWEDIPWNEIENKDNSSIGKAENTYEQPKEDNGKTVFDLFH